MGYIALFQLQWDMIANCMDPHITDSIILLFGDLVPPLSRPGLVRPHVYSGCPSGLSEADAIAPSLVSCIS